MQTANVSQCKTEMDKMMEGESYTAFVVHDRCIKSESLVVRYQCRRKEKNSDEEAKKKQRIRIGEKGDSCSEGGVGNSVGMHFVFLSPLR
jgi:hypothetical protein